jgi:predicted acylesterase/phospholipase RssA
MSAAPEPLDPAEQPPIDRYCDLVLTGGLTDGVVYPWAVLELARQYRFKNIGGTSVGAMAAALTAAAEYARRLGHVTGFNEVLLKLPEKLGEDFNGKTRLFSLFQPAPLTRRLFDLFVRYFSSGALGSATASYSQEFASDEKMRFAAARRISGRTGKLLGLVGALYRVYWLAALLGGILGPLVLLNILQAIGLVPDALVLLPPARMAVLILFLLLPATLLASLALIVYDIYTDLVRGLVPNGFGLCKGGHGKGFPAKQSSIVEWLHEGIQAAAGRQLDQPLTFKDLWDAPCGPAERPRTPALPQRKPRSIDLRMVTANLTHGRPYALPLGGVNTGSGEYDQTSRLFFKLRELDDYFPKQIIDHLEKHSQPYSKVDADDPDPGQVEDVESFRELPQGELPIVVAARLSLSFPVLFSTVPLWAIDYEAGPDRRTLQRCSFSDGGICSNFPIHLFDAAIPDWPTFGIWLAPKNIWKTETLWLPKFHSQGRGDAWNRFADPVSVRNKAAIPALDRLAGFLAGIVYSAKDWNDKATLRMAGVRDRVIRVFLDEDSQGLNLKLTGEHIMELAAKYGQPAGRALVGKFIDASPGNPPSTAWNEHRWVRFNTFLVGLRERIEALRAAAEFAGYSTPLSRQLSEARRDPPLREETPGAEKTLSGPEADDLEALLAALKELEFQFARAQIPQPYQPVPTPGLHVRPPL